MMKLYSQYQLIEKSRRRKEAARYSTGDVRKRIERGKECTLPWRTKNTNKQFQDELGKTEAEGNRRNENNRGWEKER